MPKAANSNRFPHPSLFKMLSSIKQEQMQYILNFLKARYYTGNTIFPFTYFFKVSSLPKMGPKLTTLRPRVAHSTNLASQAPLSFFLLKYIWGGMVLANIPSVRSLWAASTKKQISTQKPQF